MKYYIKLTRKGNEGSWANWIVHMLHRNCLLKHVIEGKIQGVAAWRPEGKERFKQDTGTWKGKHYIALLGELAAIEAMVLSQDIVRIDRPWRNEFRHLVFKGQE
jgi:hypothetical protein